MRHPSTRLAANSVSSAQRIEPRPEIALGTIRLLTVSAERIELGAEIHDHRDEPCGELPERSEEPSLSGSLGPLVLSGECRKSEEGEEEEDDGGTRPRACCLRHDGTLSG